MGAFGFYFLLEQTLKNASPYRLKIGRNLQESRFLRFVFFIGMDSIKFSL